MADYARAPFNLDDDAIAWVERTYAGLTHAQRVHQVFNLRSAGADSAELDRIRAFAPGGVTRLSGPDVVREHEILASFTAAAPVPVIVSADLEGSRMSPAFGTEVPNPLTLAAIDDVEATRAVYRILAEEARAAGIHWSFTPVVDVNAAFRSAIVATRGFGSDAATIERHALAQIAALQAAGVAATAKHWPGEGFDDRDQHLVTTINPLALEDWEATFGRLYRAAIDAGVMSIMSAHIALPAFVRALDPDAGVEAFRPASLSRVLTTTLLRERFGFNGLIVSDATGMAGLSAWSPRRMHIPEIIAAGCDVILFSSDPVTDAGYVAAALKDGRIPAGRLEDAVKRVLALKAAVGLHKPQQDRIAAARTTPEKQAVVQAVVERAPTLVKDTQGLLPLDPARHRRVLVVTPGIVNPWMARPLPFIVPELLAERGFEVTMHAPGTSVTGSGYDLVLYLFGDETIMTRGRISLDWLALGGNPMIAMQRPWHETPTLMISFGYPYYLYDAPRVPAYVNAYMTTESMQRAVVRALLGEIPWNLSSPVDPFVGLEDARY